MQSPYCSPKVLVVTKRLESMCATKALLNGYGFDVATVTNEQAAGAAMRAVPYQAAIVCFHSFTDAERAEITLVLRRSHHDGAIVLHCPGCKGCDEKACKLGWLPEKQWLAGLLPQMH